VDANRITITPVEVVSQASKQSGGASSQPSGGGVAGVIGSASPAPTRGDATPPADSSPSVPPITPTGVLATTPNQPATPIRPLRMTAPDVMATPRSNAGFSHADYYSGGGNLRIPHISFSTLTQMGRTDNEDPNNPGTYNYETSVTDVIGGSAGVTGLDGLYSTFNVTVSGNAVFGPPTFSQRSGMQPAAAYSGVSVANQTDPGASWYWNQFSGNQTAGRLHRNLCPE